MPWTSVAAESRFRGQPAHVTPVKVRGSSSLGCFYLEIRTQHPLFRFVESHAGRSSRKMSLQRGMLVQKKGRRQPSLRIPSGLVASFGAMPTTAIFGISRTCSEFWGYYLKDRKLRERSLILFPRVEFGNKFDRSDSALNEDRYRGRFGIPGCFLRF